MQVVFQDPYGSFDPRHKVERLVTEPLHLLDCCLVTDAGGAVVPCAASTATETMTEHNVVDSRRIIGTFGTFRPGKRPATPAGADGPMITFAP